MLGPGALNLPQLRVASYNIHKGVIGFGPSRRLSILALHDAVHRLRADLVFLQEVQFEHRRHAERFEHWPQQPQHELLGQTLGLHAAYRSNAYTRHGEHGNALLSRLPVLGLEQHDISDHPFEQRGLLHVRLDWSERRPGLVLHAINVHLGLFAASRRRQAQRLLRYMRSHIGEHEPLIVAGDFNDWRGQLGPELVAARLRDMTARGAQQPRWHQRTRTFPALLPLMPLDRVYARGFSPGNISLGWGSGWASLSDHAPLLVELRSEELRHG